MFYQRLQLFLSRPEVRQNPLKALWKRLLWRLKWLISNRPYVVPLGDKLKITIPQSGAGALIYYKGLSEPEIADFVMSFLEPGMVFFDIGAHIGEYALLGADAVGELGEVHAFEPQPSLFPLMQENVKINCFKNVVLNQMAVNDKAGEVEFEIFGESSVSSIRKQVAHNENTKIVKVAATSLDEYWSQTERKIDLIKVDVEGAEKFVFQGAEKLLNLPTAMAPTWIFEYSLTSYAGFNYHPQELLNLLQRHGFQIFEISGTRQIREFDPTHTTSGFINLIATKDKNYLLSCFKNTNETAIRDSVAV